MPTSSLPVLFVLNYRPSSEPGGGLGLARLPQFVEIELTDLEPADAERLIRVEARAAVRCRTPTCRRRWSSS